MMLKLNLNRLVQSRQKQRGFTLIEVLVTEALMGIVVTAILVAAANAYKFTSFTDARETAKNFAEYEMQYLKSSSLTPFIARATVSSYHLASPPTVFAGYNPTISQVTYPNPNDLTGQSEQMITVTVAGRNVTYSVSGYKIK